MHATSVLSKEKGQLALSLRGETCDGDSCSLPSGWVDARGAGYTALRRRLIVRWFLLLLLTYTPTGLAQDGEAPLQVDSARDITKAAEAGKSDGEILAAIKSSDHEWRAKDLIDGALF